MARSRSPIFDNVDPRLAQLIQQLGGKFGNYGVRATSGYRPGDPRYHGRGSALDVELFDPATGTALENYQDPKNFAAYQQLANALYSSADPELQKLLRWGGYFSGGSGKYGALDLMHFDVGGGETGMAGGSWAGGLTPEQAKIWGLQTGGGIGGAGANQIGPAMPKSVTDFSPEQRRNAIASIESAGSGDYGAMGPWVARKSGSGPNAKDRAYGRYQVMGSNIPVWTQQVLGRAMTPEEFVANPKAQDAVFDKIFGEYVRKHGEEGAASMWFTGRPDAFNAKDVLGTSGGDYIKKYMAALTGAPAAGNTTTYPDQAAPVANTQVAEQGGDQVAKDRKEAFSGLADAAASIFGGGGGGGGAGGGGRRSISQLPATMANPVAPYTTTGAVTPEQAQARLQLALQKLSAGKLV